MVKSHNTRIRFDYALFLKLKLFSSTVVVCLPENQHSFKAVIKPVSGAFETLLKQNPKEDNCLWPITVK